MTFDEWWEANQDDVYDAPATEGSNHSKITHEWAWNHGVKVDDFVEDLYRAGWAAPNDAQHFKILEVFRKYCVPIKG